MFKQRKLLFLGIVLIITIVGLSVISAENIDENNVSSDSVLDTNDNSTIDYLEFIPTNSNSSIKKQSKEVLKKEDYDANCIYVDTSGSSSSNGRNISSPTTLSNALSIVENNDCIFLLGEEDNVYSVNENITNINMSSSVKEFKISSYDKQVTLNFSSDYNVQLYGKYNILISNITFTRNGISNMTFIDNNANLTLANCLFKNINSASKYGIIHNNNSLTLNECSFVDNIAQHGGLIYNENVSVFIDNSIFEDNSANEGGVLTSINSKINILNSTFNNNSALFGGVFVVKDNTKLNVSKSTFNNNSARYYGGVVNSWYSSNVLNNCIFIDNSADVGGVVYSGNNLCTNISDSFFENNTATNTSSIAYSYYDNLSIVNSVILNKDYSNSIFCDNSSYILDNNWWGINNPDFSLLTNNLLPNNWRVMTVEGEVNNDVSIINVSLNRLTDGKTADKELFNRKISYLANDSVLNFENNTITSTCRNNYYGNLDDVVVKIDNQSSKIGDKITPYININPNSLYNNTLNFTLNCNPDIGNIRINVDEKYLADLKPLKGVSTYSYVFDSSYDNKKHNITAILTNSSRYVNLNKTISVTLNYLSESIVNLVKNNQNISEENVSIKSRLNVDTARLVQTPIKFQGSSGSCWAFGALSTLESAYLKAYNISYNFSENNMKNAMKKYSVLGDKQGYPNTGNKELEPIAYLVGWYGPVDEISDSYDEYSTMSSSFNNILKVEDVYFIYRNSFVGKDNKVLKEAISKYGAIASSIYSSYSTASSKGMYTTITPYADHAISIVGWDDFYSKDNFYGLNKPKDSGAYIIKNSWGDSVGEGGYQYVSYYDTSLAGVNVNSNITAFSYAFPVKTYENYTNIYQHDTVSTEIISLNPSAWIRNIYTARNNESIAGVGTFIYEDCDYEAYIYVNDKLYHKQEGNFSQAGYRIIKLDKYVSVNKGDVFRVDLKLTAKKSNDIHITIQDTNHYNSISKEKQSYISRDGVTWSDLYYSYDYPASAACLKVYTKDVPRINSTVTNNSNTYTVTSHVTNVKTKSRLYYTIDGEICADNQVNPIYVDVEEDGIYTTSIPVENVKSYEFNLSVNIEKENNIVSEVFTLESPLELKIITENISYFADEKQVIEAEVEVNNIYHTPVNEGSVKLFKDNVCIDECDVVNGSVIFIVNEVAGNYSYVLVYNSENTFACENTTVNLTVRKHDVDIIIDDLTDNNVGKYVLITGHAITRDGKLISNKPLNVKIDSDNLNITTDDDGRFEISYYIARSGEYEFSIEFNENTTHYYSIVQDAFVVSAQNSIISIDNIENVKFGDTVNITGRLKSQTGTNIDGNIILIINGKIHNTVTSEGMFNYEYNTDTVGINNLTIIFRGNEVYSASQANSSFTVDKVATRIIMETSDDVYVNENVNIKGKLLYVDKVLENNEINIIIDNNPVQVSLDSSNSFNYEFNCSEVGLKYIEIIFCGDDVFEGCEYNTTIEVMKIYTSLTVDISEDYSKLTVTGELTDHNNNYLNNESIIITVNNKNYSATTDSNGKYSIEADIDHVGEYTVLADYTGNQYYHASSTNKTVIVNKKEVNLIIDTVENSSYNHDIKINGMLTDKNNKPIKDASLTIILNDNNYTTKTLENGSYTYITKAKNIGTNNISIEYSGSEYYCPAVVNKSFEVNKQNVTVTLDKIEEVNAGTNVTITGKFMDDLDKAISNSNIHVYVNDKKFMVRTDKNGEYTLSALVTKVGENTLSVGYGGNTKYNAYEYTSTFNAGKQDVIVTYDTITEVKAGTNVTITGTFTDNLGKVLSNSNVRLYVNGVKYYAKTDKTGKYTLSTLVTKVGINNLTVGYGGSAKYNEYNVNTTFTVGKQDVIVTYDEIGFVSEGSNVTITGKFTDNLGKAITNSNVRIFINAKKYFARTDNNGQYSLSVGLSKGSYNLSVGYGGSAKYNAYETNTTFTVGKQDVIVTYDKIEDVAVGANVTITGKFTDINGRTIANSNVRIFVNGIKYLSRTDKNGFYNFSVKVTNIGTNNVSVGYGGNDKYNSYEANTTFNVGKQDVVVSCENIEDTKYGNNITVKGKFMDANQNAISNSNVKIMFNGKKYLARTDKTGSYELNITADKTGTNTISVGYGGNTKYNAYTSELISFNVY